MKFGDYLKQQRDKHNWTQPQAADTIGIEQSYLSKLENNKAIPSADIFDRLMSAYQFDIKELGSLMNDSELNKLKDIVLVRDFIITSKKQSATTRRRWLIAGLAMLVLGAGLITHGSLTKQQLHVNYIYESKGKINPNESRLLYSELPDYRSYLAIIQRPDDSRAKLQLTENPLFERLDYEQMTASKYLGDFVDEGNRRYHWVHNKEVMQSSPFFFALTLGTMLVIGGIASLFISRRW